MFDVSNKNSLVFFSGFFFLERRIWIISQVLMSKITNRKSKTKQNLIEEKSSMETVPKMINAPLRKKKTPNLLKKKRLDAGSPLRPFGVVAPLVLLLLFKAVGTKYETWHPAFAQWQSPRQLINLKKNFQVMLCDEKSGVSWLPSGGDYHRDRHIP